MCKKVSNSSGTQQIKLLQTFPQPNGHGWDTNDGKLEYQWTEYNLMPQELVDILVEEEDSVDQDDGKQEDDDYETANLRDIIFDREEYSNCYLKWTSWYGLWNNTAIRFIEQEWAYNQWILSSQLALEIYLIPRP